MMALGGAAVYLHLSSREFKERLGAPILLASNGNDILLRTYAR